MIYYKEEKKKLVIPSGFVMIPIDCDEAIEQAREQGYQEGFADGSSATCDTEEGTYSLTDDFDGEETVFPSEGKTGFNKIVIVDDGYGDKKYSEGYESGSTDGFNTGYDSGYTEGYAQGQEDCPECSGGTCNLEAGVLNLIADGPTWIVYPFEGYDGFSEVTVNDMGYGQGKFNEGYQNGYADGRESIASGCPMQEKFISLSTIEESVSPDYGYAGLSEVHINAENFYNTAYNDGYAAGLEDCSGSTDCTSAITEAYQSGYTEGYTQGQADCPQCSGGTCNLTDAWIDLMDGDDFEGQGVDYYVSAITPNYDGWYKVHIQDKDYGQSKYDEGYADGQADCSGGTCNLESGQASLGYDWTGFTRVYPSQGYDGLSDVIVADLGYGQRKFDEGYADGHTSGYTEGYNEAITANCGSAITEAYESGYTEGYNAADTKIYSSSKDVYFDELAWVDVENSTAYSEEDTIMIDYKWGNTVTGSNTIVLFSNESDDPTAANPPSPTTPSFSIVLHTAGLSITTDDGQGNRQIWTGLYRSAQLNHSYRLIVQTYSYTSSVTIKAALIDLTSGQITTGSTNGAFHFTGATSLNYCINGYRNTADAIYEGMNTDWYLGGIRIFDNTGRMKHNYHFLNGCISDVVNDLETGYEAKYYDNSVETTYSLTGVEETMRFFY